VASSCFFMLQYYVLLVLVDLLVLEVRNADFNIDSRI